MPVTSPLLDQAHHAIERKLFAMKGFHHPGGSQQAFLTGLAHLYNLVPYQRRAQHAGQCGVEVEGGQLPTHDWLLTLQILTSGGYQRAAETLHHEIRWSVINSCTLAPNSSVRYCLRSFPRASPYPVAPRQRSAARGSSPVTTPTFTRLQKRDPQRNQHRYCLLSIQPNLFGTWSLIREWGRIGRPGRVQIDLCDSLEEATDAFRGKLHQKQRRGYA
jgi:predicted DNA-binding WGR domain protein